MDKIDLKPNLTSKVQSNIWHCTWNKSVALALLLLALFNSCQDHSAMTYQAYMEWYKDVDNGLYRVKEVNGYRLQLKYVPAEYLIYREKSQNPKLNNDSIAAYYKDNLSFLLSITPIGSGQGQNRNILFDRIEKFEDYKKRVFDLNFNVEELIELRLQDGTRLVPSLYNIENTYGLSKELNFNLMFSPGSGIDFKKSDTFDIVLNDFVFETGINHFVYNRSELQHLPTIR